MSIRTHFRSASDRLLAHRRRTVLWLLGFALGSAAMVVSGAIERQGELAVERLADAGPDLIVAAKTGEPSLPRNLLGGAAIVEVATHAPPSSYHHIKPYPEILSLALRTGAAAGAPFVTFDGILRNRIRRAAVTVRGIDPSLERHIGVFSRPLHAGSLDSLDDLPEGIILGAGLARDLGAIVGRDLRLVTAAAPIMRMKVAGIVESGIPEIDGRYCWINLPLAQKLRGMPPAAITGLSVRLHDGADLDEMSARLASATRYSASRVDDQVGRTLLLHERRSDLFEGVALLILLASAAGLATVLLGDIIEDRGARRSAAPASLVIEGGIVGAAGAAIGLGIGAVVVSALAGTTLLPSVGSDADIGLNVLIISHVPSIYLVSAAAVILAAMIACVPPALRAARMQRGASAGEGA